ncbi:MAG TPA: DUF2203 domain-containing protein [Bryobacteraceae bacterium]|nr:DUF2203 domain-containing protein [Bryobacteraceae bacterium]
MPKRFTLAQAESLIPTLAPLLRKAIECKQQYAGAEQELQNFHQRIAVAGGVLVNRDLAAAVKGKRDSAAQRLKDVINEVQKYGCVVKDLDIGLLDFPSWFGGREVYLCWKLGEPAIGFWHGTDEGFAGRKQIDAAFREQHRGDRTQ